MARAREDAPERKRTDDSLKRERKKTDQALSERKATADGVVRQARAKADEVVRRARGNADAVMNAAREKADQKTPEVPAMSAERRVADEALRAERSDADKMLQAERDEAGRVLAALLPFEREATDRYLLTERRHSDDAISNRDDFLSIVSHDLRNLLAGIVTGTSLIAKRAGDGQDGLETLAVTERMHRYAARMNRLVGDLQDIGSIDAGKLAVTPTDGDLGALLEDAVEAFRVAAEAKAMTVTVDGVDGALRARFDHDRILQVLANLLANSIKFTDRGGKILVQCERTREAYRVSVSDNGPGIADTMLDSVFERFWQAGKDDRRGFGLGLYISRCIVEAHGGKIWAESTLTKGSHFRFTLPIASDELH